MGRALMIPGMVGRNIQQWLNDGKLPNTVGQFGSTPEEIFVCVSAKVKGAQGLKLE
jgi:hypothetical protein